MNQTPESRFVLPDAGDALRKVKEGTASALDRFVFFYQPHNGAGDWRRDMQAVVDELTALQPQTLREMLLADESTKGMLEEIRKEFLGLKEDLEEILAKGGRK